MHRIIPIINKIHFHMLRTSMLLICFTYIHYNVVGQVTGAGTYGATEQTYEQPKSKGKILFVAPDGKSTNVGSSLKSAIPFAEAIKQANTGDVIIMRGGTYRIGNIRLNQGITIQPFKNEIPILKGSLIATGWKKGTDGIWSTPWKQLFPGRPEAWWDSVKFGNEVPRHLFNNDMVFFDGAPLTATHSISTLTNETFYIDYRQGLVYLSRDPSNHSVEITANDIGLIRTTNTCYGKLADKKGFKIKGIAFTHYTYTALDVEGLDPGAPMNEAAFGGDVVGTTIENCSFSFARIGAFLRGDSLTVSHCTVSNTVTEGLYIAASSDVILNRNLFTKNNIKKLKGYYPAAVKVFNQCHRVKVADNKFTDIPYSNGIWFDVGNVDCRFVNNWVENIGNIAMRDPKNPLWPLSNGFFFEISTDGVCAGNVFLNCDNGALVYNSANVKLYNNTFVNSSLAIGRTSRNSAADLTFGWHSDAGPKTENRDGHSIVNNLLVADSSYAVPLLLVWQPDSLCQKLNRSQVSELDYNYFVRDLKSGRAPLIVWSPVQNQRCLAIVNSPGDLQQYGPYSKYSAIHRSDTLALFSDARKKDFRILPKSPLTRSGTKLPENIKHDLGLPNREFKYAGAYTP
jgi:hypothetical protein